MKDISYRHEPTRDSGGGRTITRFINLSLHIYTVMSCTDAHMATGFLVHNMAGRCGHFFKRRTWA